MNEYVPEKYILYAEDDEDDQETLKETLPLVDPELEVIAVNNGLELIQFLDDLPADASTPCLIILDVNMPLWDGIHTLRALKSTDRYKELPVVMFSTSNDTKDIELSLRIGALDFVTKPVRHHEVENIIKRFAEYCNMSTSEKS